MKFAFSDEQLAMRDAVRAFLEKECPPKVVRDAWTNDTGRSGLWPRLGELGVLGVLASEAQGGFGGDYLDLILLLEETGRAALPEPVVEHAAVTVPLLDEARSEAAAAGAVTITVAPHPVSCSTPTPPTSCCSVIDSSNRERCSCGGTSRWTDPDDCPRSLLHLPLSTSPLWIAPRWASPRSSSASPTAC